MCDHLLNIFRLFLKIWVYFQAYKNYILPRSGKNERNIKFLEIKKNFGFGKKVWFSRTLLPEGLKAIPVNMRQLIGNIFDAQTICILHNELHIYIQKISSSIIRGFLFFSGAIPVAPPPAPAVPSAPVATTPVAAIRPPPPPAPAPGPGAAPIVRMPPADPTKVELIKE